MLETCGPRGDSTLQVLLPLGPCAKTSIHIQRVPSFHLDFPALLRLFTPSFELAGGDGVFRHRNECDEAVDAEVSASLRDPHQILLEWLGVSMHNREQSGSEHQPRHWGQPSVVLVNFAGRFETNTSPTRQQRKGFPRVPLESFPVVKLARSDDELEIPMFGESLLKKLVSPFPATPILPGWLGEMRRKSAQFEHKLAEGGRCNRRKCPKNGISSGGEHDK